MKKAMLFAGAAALGAAAMGRRAGPRGYEVDEFGQSYISSELIGPMERGDRRWKPAWDHDFRMGFATGKRMLAGEFGEKYIGPKSGYKRFGEGRGSEWLVGYKAAIDMEDGVDSKALRRAQALGLTNRGRGRRAATRRRTYKTLAGLKRAMGDRGQLSLETIFSERANIKGVGWTPIRYTLTDEDISEIATKLGGYERTQHAVANGLRYGRISKLPYSTRQRITWDKYGWGYIAGQDHRAETARIRNILKK
jgi:hypothetical protein